MKPHRFSSQQQILLGCLQESCCWLEPCGSSIFSTVLSRRHTEHVTNTQENAPTLILTSFGASFFTSLKSLSPKPAQDKNKVV